MNWQETAAFAIVITSAVIGLVAFPLLPEKIPMHWNTQGNADAWSGKWSVFLMPVVSAGLLLLFRVIPRVAVKKRAFKKSKRYYDAMILSLLGFLLMLQAGVAYTALNPGASIKTFLITGISFVFLVIGWASSKFEQNYFVGFRTPWALADKRVWKKTQEYGGKSMMLLSAVVLLNVFTSNFMLFFITPLIAWIASVFVYSYAQYTRIVKKA